MKDRAVEDRAAADEHRGTAERAMKKRLQRFPTKTKLKSEPECPLFRRKRF